MNSTLYLSCVVFIIGCLVWTASAQGGNNFESERIRMLGIYGDPRVHQFTKLRNIPVGVDFLDKYLDQIEMTPEQRSRAIEALRIYKEEQAKQVLVDNMPPQGGVWDYIGREMLKLLIDIASTGFKKATKK